VYWLGVARRQIIPIFGPTNRRRVCTRADALPGNQKRSGDEESWMLNQVIARLCKSLGKAREGHGVHAPFRVTTHRGHTVQTYDSLESAIEAAELLGPDHYVIDRHGLQIWNPERKLLRNEE
jgi:hypothetical protein